MYRDSVLTWIMKSLLPGHTTGVGKRVLIGNGLPCIQKKLLDKIRSWEYVELSELLPRRTRQWPPLHRVPPQLVFPCSQVARWCGTVNARVRTYLIGARRSPFTWLLWLASTRQLRWSCWSTRSQSLRPASNMMDFTGGRTTQTIGRRPQRPGITTGRTSTRTYSQGGRVWFCVRQRREDCPEVYFGQAPSSGLRNLGTGSQTAQAVAHLGPSCLRRVQRQG